MRLQPAGKDGGEGYAKGKGREGRAEGGRWKGNPSSTFQPHTAGKAIDRENLPGNPSHPLVSLLPSCMPDAHRREARQFLRFLQPKFIFLSPSFSRTSFSRRIRFSRISFPLSHDLLLRDKERREAERERRMKG